MKLQPWLTALVLGLGLSAQGALFTYNWTGLNATIPDNNPSGYVNNQTVSDAIQGNPAFLGNPYLASVVGVRIDVSGGWNGDLVVYLRHETAGGTGYTTLLNRVGTTASPFNPVGYTTAGMNVTLTDATGADIHTVESPTTSGTYLVDQTGSSVTFNSFQGLDANGTWSLFFADLSGNNVSTLNGWVLDLQVVPEPVNVALGIFGVGLTGVAGARWYLRARKARQHNV